MSQPTTTPKVARLVREPHTDALFRWAEGRKAHGSGEWVGRPPLEEAYEEVLDLMNYLAEHQRSTTHRGQWEMWELEALQSLVLAVAWRITHLLSDDDSHTAPTDTAHRQTVVKVSQ